MYATASLIMATTIRPNLAPKTFVASTRGFPSSSPFAQSDCGAPWYIGYGYQFSLGSHHPTDASAADIGRRCENLTGDFFACFTHNDLQMGHFYQLASNYWTLQWKVYVIATAFLLAIGLWLVRRWRA